MKDNPCVICEDLEEKLADANARYELDKHKCNCGVRRHSLENLYSTTPVLDAIWAKMILQNHHNHSCYRKTQWFR
jgi:hypothetical protein